MALSRVKTWNAAETLTASDLNAEFNNICNHFGSLDNDDIDSTATYTMGELIVGSGIASADGGQLHVHTATAGTIQASADADEAVFENSGASGVTILSGATSTGNIAFGDSGDADNGLLKYTHGATPTLGITVNATAVQSIAAAATTLAHDLAIYQDANNADSQIALGTSATEALFVDALNGGSNKTLEELRFTTKTASGTANHGKMSFYVDEVNIGNVNDDGITLESGKIFTGNITGNVTGNTSGTAATVTSGTQAAITTCANLTTVGTVTTGTWSGVIDGSATMTLGSDATGDIYFRDASGFLERLAAGADGYVLTGTGAGSIPAYEALPSSGISWDGSTANGVATFKDSDEATVEANLTFDGSTLAVTGATTATSDITGLTLNATGDTAAGDNAAMGYTAAEGLILAGQGSTNDVTIKNDADATVLNIPTGTKNVGIGVNPAYYAVQGRLMTRGVYTALTSGIGDSTVFVSGANSYSGKANTGGVLAFGGEYDSSSNITHWAGIAGLADNNTNSNYAGYMAFYTRANGAAAVERMRLTSDGNAGIGLTPSYRLDVYNDHSGGFAGRLRNDGNNVNRWGLAIMCGADDSSGTNIAAEFYDGDGTLQGGITFSGGTVTYGAFTANHDAELPEADSDGYEYGTLVETTEIFYKKNSSGDDFERGIRYKARKSSSANSKALLGAYAGKYESGGLVLSEAVEAVDEVLYVDGDELPEGKSIGDVKTPAIEAADAVYSENRENLHQIYVLGDGHVLCNNSQGNIEVGDGITSSTTDGIGCKATVSGLIIAIAQQDITFTGSETKLVPVQYGLQQWVNLSAIDELTARITALESA